MQLICHEEKLTVNAAIEWINSNKLPLTQDKNYTTMAHPQNFFGYQFKCALDGFLWDKIKNIFLIFYLWKYQNDSFKHF